MVQRKPPIMPPGDGRRNGPVRMCIGCRQRAAVSVLVRVVAREGVDGPRVVVDFAKTMPGRGAWLHPAPGCVSGAVRRRAFAVALRTTSPVANPDDLAEAIGAGDRSPIADDSRLDIEPEQVAEDMSTP